MGYIKGIVGEEEGGSKGARRRPNSTITSSTVQEAQGKGLRVCTPETTRWDRLIA